MGASSGSHGPPANRSATFWGTGRANRGLAAPPGPGHR